MRRSFVLAFALLAACGGTSHSASPSSTSSPASTTRATTTTTTALDFGRAYLALVAPVNSATDTFERGVKALPAGSDLPSSVLDPFVQATQTFDQKALRIAWPSTTRADVRQLVQDDTILVAALAQVNNQTALSGAGFESELARDEAKVSADASIVRADLGLAPPPG